MSKIAIIGSGNVATQLGIALKNCGHKIACVYSRNIAHAGQLAKKLHSSYSDNFKQISDDIADIFIIAVKDDAISAVVRKIPLVKKGLVIHTSGATDISVLKKKFNNCGVLWQVQTIQLRTKADFKNIPLVIEANNSSAKKKITALAKSLSSKVYYFNSRQRSILHLGAVWVNNFTNHLYYLSRELLKKHHLPYDLYAPLILSTAENGIINPEKSQTGPAKRNDKKSMHRHLQLLSSNKKYKEIYLLLSGSILDSQKTR